MLEYIHLRCFQKHLDKRIEFDPRVTMLVGRSDSGKTSILRGLGFVALNEIPKPPVPMHGYNTAEVELGFDGHVAIRTKGEHNKYRLDDEEYVAFGHKVPDAITNLLNISPFSFSNQHDGIFWLSDSAGEVSRELNAIVNLQCIDRVLSNVATNLRRARSTVELTEERLASVKKKRDELAWVKQMDADLSRIEKVYTKWQETKQKLTKLNALIVQLRVCRTAARKKYPDLTLLDNVVKNWQQTRLKQEALCKLIQRIKKARAEKESKLKTAQQLALEWEEALKIGICPVCGREPPMSNS